MIWSTIVSFVNLLISMLGKVLSLLFLLLPNSPFDLIDFSFINEYMGYLNYIVPVSDIIKISVSWVGCIGVYYIIQIALRWAKVVE